MTKWKFLELDNSQIHKLNNSIQNEPIQYKNLIVPRLSIFKFLKYSPD